MKNNFTSTNGKISIFISILFFINIINAENKNKLSYHDINLIFQ